ncbi:unnamed protein product [Cutaneotrichosporon oleaginosum]
MATERQGRLGHPCREKAGDEMAIAFVESRTATARLRKRLLAQQLKTEQQDYQASLVFSALAKQPISSQSASSSNPSGSSPQLSSLLDDDEMLWRYHGAVLADGEVALIDDAILESYRASTPAAPSSPESSSATRQDSTPNIAVDATSATTVPDVDAYTEHAPSSLALSLASPSTPCSTVITYCPSGPASVQTHRIVYKSSTS